MSLATDYWAALRAARKLQLDDDADAVRDLEQLLANTAAQLRKDIQTVPRGVLGERYRRDLMASINASLDQFRDRFKDILDPAILEAARIAEERERVLVQNLLAHADELPLDQKFAVQLDAMRSANVSLGNVPQKVLEKAYIRTYSDGLKLSDRLYNVDRDARKAAADIVTDGLATGMSARRMADRLEALLTTDEQRQKDIAAKAERETARKAVAEANLGRAADKQKPLPPKGIDNLAARTKRIARTEINTAYREGHIESCTDPDSGQLKPWISAIGWRLSPAHPRTDICDAWAGDDTEDLGEGNYSPDNVPPGHPNCLCYTVSILAILPDEQFVSKVALPDEVPEAQRKYYGSLKSGSESEEE